MNNHLLLNCIFNFINSFDGDTHTQELIDDRGARIFQKSTPFENYQSITAPQTKMSDVITKATNLIPRFKV